MISWTSPSASGYGLPISRVISRESASLLASNSRPTSAITRPRAGAGTAAQARWARARGAAGVLEALRVGQQDLGDDLGRVARGWSTRAARPARRVRSWPSMIDAAVRVEVAVSGMPRTLARAGGQALLERVDRAHADRVDAAQHREVERDEVAEQHERDQPLEPRLAAGAHPLHHRGPRRRPARR